MSDHLTDLELLILQIQRIDGCERTKAAALEVFKRQEGKVIRFTHRLLTRPEQVRRAKQLLDAGHTRAEARDRLVGIYGCSRRHAYNLIREALNERHKAAIGRAL